MGGVGLARGPDFMQQECARAISGAVQIVEQAALFPARWSDQGAQFGLEEQFLTFAGAQMDDEGYRLFRKLLVFRSSFTR